MLLLLLTLIVQTVSAQQTPAPAQTGSSMNLGAVMSVTTIVILGLIIAILGHAVIGAKAVYRERMKREKENAASQVLKILVLLAGSLVMTLATTAQTTAVANTSVAVSVSDTIGGMSSNSFYLVAFTVILEVVAIIFLVNLLKFLTGIQQEQPVKATVAGAPSALAVWWDKLNKSVAIEKEKDIDLSHDYDGIRELDNSIPPWWTWTFVACFIFSVVYLWRYHVSESAPLQIQELELSIRKAEAKKDAYLQTAAKKVDENTVTMADAAGITAGQTTYKRNCITCHGNNGEGNSIGPNLTDDYWLHKGGIKDIFKSVKYGWVEKGMQSWQGVLSSTEIAEVSSYIKSISGTNYPNGKASQGDLYKEETPAAAAGDTAKTTMSKQDSVSVKK